MLAYIEKFLDENMTPEYVKSRMDAIRLIQTQGLYSPIDILVEIIDSSAGIPVSEIVLLVDEVISNILTDILMNMYILTDGSLLYKTDLLKGLNLLEEYIDSEVILENYNPDEETMESLVQLLNLVTDKSAEYFDEHLIDVRPALLTQLVEHHENLTTMDLNTNELDDRGSRILLIKQFNEKYPNTIAITSLKEGLVKLELDMNILLSIFKSNIYTLLNDDDIAANLIALVLISNTSIDEIVQVANNLVTELYNDVTLISQVKHKLNRIELED